MRELRQDVARAAELGFKLRPARGGLPGEGREAHEEKDRLWGAVQLQLSLQPSWKKMRLFNLHTSTPALLTLHSPRAAYSSCCLMHTCCVLLTWFVPQPAVQPRPPRRSRPCPQPPSEPRRGAPGVAGRAPRGPPSGRGCPGTGRGCCEPGPGRAGEWRERRNGGEKGEDRGGVICITTCK